MALLTAEEKKKLSGISVKHKCDYCGKPIISSLIFGTQDGHETCSKACRDAFDSESNNSNSLKEKKMKFAKKKDTDDEDVKKKSKSKKAKDEDEDEEEENDEEDEEEENDEEDEEDEDEEDEKPKKGKAAKKGEKPAKGKKKSKKGDDDEDEKPKKGGKKGKRESTVGTKTNPYKEDSHIYEVLEAVKKGIKPGDLKKMCKKNGVDYGWTMSVLRKHGKKGKRGVSWKLKETDDKIKATLN